MKLTAINNTLRQNKTNSNNISNKQNNNQKNVSFKGFADAAVTFWKFVDAGGRGLQFTVEDMLGTNFPRTYKGAMAGYKYTGEVNVPALIQEALREFLTGPTMTLAPFGILAVAKKLGGKSSNTHIENIKNLSHIASQLPEGEVSKEAFKNDFLNAVVKDMIQQSTEVEPQEKDVKSLIEGIVEYGELSSKSKKTKAEKKKASEVLENLGNTFEKIVKANKKDYKGTDFEVAKYTISNSAEKGATSFSNYVKYINAYIDDYTKKNLKGNNVNLNSKAIDAFKQSCIGKRAMTIVSMIGLTGVIMSFIPKIYTLASGKINPNAANIYNEAQKKEGK